ncbi:MAG: UTP--glucose-1-phosphate uridylyltransferase [Myxococcales bacterium]|nr:UTP--glucose-1-phosphate uridylyltransferase [Myxococcales bacterium]MDH3484179.1 UTP--glucose-1-phosphate uridylyltransferase [Myxococcales bacterium]
MDSRDIDDETLQLLQRYGFEDIPFESLQKRLAEGTAGSEQNRIRGNVEPPEEGDLKALPPIGGDLRRELTELGTEAMHRGEVAAVILAGGMATRFGGAVKAAVEVLDGASFLELKLRDIAATAQRCDARIPVYLMTSFATDDVLRKMAESLTTDRCPIKTFPQFISLRLTPEGQLFRDKAGALSPYAPGHGDLTFALRRSGIMESFHSSGGRTLMMSNVDNLTATLDPAVIGAHIKAGAALTAEMAPKERGDKGGAPARVDGRAQIVESFRFPADFDQERIPVFNTNTFVLDARSIDAEFPLTWFAVNKTVDGKPAVQFERLVGELTAFLDPAFLRVERHGPDARFQPIKTPEDVDKERADIVKALEARGSLSRHRRGAS